ncbi:MAG: hypothetical protein B6226_01150 [Candidatus Cloacimonetes bacterium 4572_65]|nr:MAG: hypothetical protein B6226_01150 [Candidatus Cloacimonetes bacterium 4572_65]
MPIFKFLGFQQNLLKIENYIDDIDKSILVYPTMNNVTYAQKFFQDEWLFEDILFLSMDDLKGMINQSDSISLEDDKRVIGLYSTLTEEEKGYFNITDFFDFIKLSNKIFSLFNELGEELTNPEDVISLIKDAGHSIFDWQEEYYLKIVDLMERYRVWLTDKGLADKIFLKTISNINLTCFSGYKRIYFINQFYFSGFEREVISLFEKEGIEVTLVYQMPEALVDKESYSCIDFNYHDLVKSQNFRPDIKVHVNKNKFSMLNSLCGVLEKEDINQIIDKEFYENSYSKVLSSSIFSVSYSYPITNTGFYHFLEILNMLLENYENYNDRFYIPINLLIRALLNPTFSSYFGVENSGDVVDELNKLHDRGILYLDRGINLKKINYSDVINPIVEKLFLLLGELMRVSSINSFISLIDNEEGLVIDRLCSADELLYSDIKEVIYTELANLKSFNFHNLISSWEELSKKPVHTIIFRLFYDGIKSKTIMKRPVTPKKRIKVNSLIDTRNNQYESLAFLNMTEGAFPKKRSTQFLFSELQREALNLKTYDDIRLREKYYFFRLLLTTRKAHLFAIEDLDENSTISSFIEELRIDEAQYDIDLNDFGYKNLYAHGEDLDKLEVKSDFFTLKVDSEEFYGDYNTLKLSYTKLSDLLKNPFAFMIKNYGGVFANKLPQEPQMGFRFVGNLAQEFVNHIINRINSNSIGRDVFYKFKFIGDDYLGNVFSSLLRTLPNRDYLIPHNYSLKFVEKILSDVLIDGMRNFFNTVMHKILHLSERKIKLIPEGDYMTKEERDYKEFVAETENNFNLNIAVRGVADLRIEVINSDEKYVIDFKTGSYNMTQLALYLYIYYWGEVQGGDNVKSAIYQIIKNKWDDGKSAEESIEKLKGSVIDVLNEITSAGFYIPDNLKDSKIYEEITRSDLMRRS